MGTPPDIERLRTSFGDFVEVAGSRAPLYAALSQALADDDEVPALLMAAHPSQQRPVMLFAAVHHLLLDGRETPLSVHYRSLSGAEVHLDRAAAQRDFHAFCQANADELRAVMSTRRVQTNEVGRTSLLRAALGELDPDRPISLIDLGASAGLLLGVDRYRTVYEPGGSSGPVSTVVATCGVRGRFAPPVRLPVVSVRLGLDLAPPDLEREDDRRWLEACVWPDEPDRLARLRAAIEVVRTLSPQVRQGDLLDDLATVIARARRDAPDAVPVVLTSWSLSYLDAMRQQLFVETLDTLGRSDDLVWVAVESPAEVPVLPGSTDEPHLTSLVLTCWRDGLADQRVLAQCHPHGHWMHWLS